MTSERWSSTLGFVLATVGAAVGLGNIWRFSAVVGTNGGGAYLVPYLLAVFCFAVLMLVLELAVGRTLRTDVVSSGVRGGIERLSNVVMPTVFALLVGLALYAVTLPAWPRAVTFLFRPGRTSTRSRRLRRRRLPP